jgi:CRISPR-associated endonuclease/helicase Cas3
MTYLAREGQIVSCHLENVAEICRDLSGKIGASSLGELLGLLHDLGKYSNQFQAYIKSATGMLNPDIDENYVDSSKLKGSIDHSTAGAQWLWQQCSQYGQQGQLVGQILALCLASHHGGLIDCLSSDGENSFLKRMGKDDEKTHLKECVNAADEELLQRLKALVTPQLIQNCVQQISVLVNSQSESLIKSFNVGLWTRFLFSCLLDADRIDSADTGNPENREQRRKGPVDWPVAIGRLEKELSALPVIHEIDHIRRDISVQCKDRAHGVQGIYSLTVPTGGGKTFASIRYALHHAREHKLERIIYIIPFTSIIEQNAEVIRKVIERETDEFSWVLEHHSNLEPEQQTWQYKLVSENWDAPIIFTTMVQFLETLFGGGTRGPRRMHQLAKAVLVFDEVQTLPIKCVHLFCNAINFLTEHTKTTALLCTATQPLLNKLKEPKKGQLNIPPQNELVEDVSGLFDQLKRVDMRNRIRPGGWSESEIADLAIEELELKGSCLVIVNTKAWAQRLFKLTEDRSDKRSVFHLSTSLCPAHRKVLLKEIRQRLDDELPVLCISTQLIEAGVDVDFAAVIRFLAGFDSIAQAAGRCNRNGKRTMGEVHVVNPDRESIEMLTDIREGRNKALRVLSERGEADLLNPDVIEQYFTYYFYQRSDEMAYPVSAKQASRTDSLLNMLGDNPLNVGRKNDTIMLQQSFKAVGKIFKAIDAPTEAVVVQYGAGKDIIAELCAEQNPAKIRMLLKESQKYSVSVFPNVWRKLKEQNAVIPIQDEGIYFLDERHYSKQFGLSVEPVSDYEPQIV